MVAEYAGVTRRICELCAIAGDRGALLRQPEAALADLEALDD